MDGGSLLLLRVDGGWGGSRRKLWHKHLIEMCAFEMNLDPNGTGCVGSIKAQFLPWGLLISKHTNINPSSSQSKWKTFFFYFRSFAFDIEKRCENIF